MSSDLPHVNYGKAGRGDRKEAPVRAGDPAFRLQQEANERARMRRMTRGGVTVDELFAERDKSHK